MECKMAFIMSSQFYCSDIIVFVAPESHWLFAFNSGHPMILKFQPMRNTPFTRTSMTIKRMSSNN